MLCTISKAQYNGCLSASSTGLCRAYGGRTPIGRIANWKGGDARKAADLLNSCNSSFVLPAPAAPPAAPANKHTDTPDKRRDGEWSNHCEWSSHLRHHEDGGLMMIIDDVNVVAPAGGTRQGGRCELCVLKLIVQSRI